MLTVSDNLLHDTDAGEQIIARLQGLSNVWNGSYQTNETQRDFGTGYCILVEPITPKLSNDMSETLADGLKAAHNLTSAADPKTDLRFLGSPAHVSVVNSVKTYLLNT